MRSRWYALRTAVEIPFWMLAGVGVGWMACDSWGQGYNRHIVVGLCAFTLMSVVRAMLAFVEISIERNEDIRQIISDHMFKRQNAGLMLETRNTDWAEDGT